MVRLRFGAPSGVRERERAPANERDLPAQARPLPLGLIHKGRDGFNQADYCTVASLAGSTDCLLLSPTQLETYEQLKFSRSSALSSLT